jgi:glycerol-3-phosphate dehydrogenase subunit C
LAAPISYRPTDGLSYDPIDEKYWDEGALAKEVTRVFEICHGCRMCFKYCDSFPTLFDLLDTQYEGDVHKLTDSDVGSVMDACFQCKLCEVQCPYTPRDGHEYQLDFPKLVHRYQAQRFQDDPPGLREVLLADPDGTAKFARMSLGLANAMNKVKAHRWFLEKVLGIHRDKSLPSFVRETFETWAKKNGKVRKAPAETVLFQTCFVQNNDPQLGKDTLEVMAHNGVETACAEGLACCGMPAWEYGDLDRLRSQAKQTLDVLTPFVDEGSTVLVINPTCSMMMRKEWPHLLEGEDRVRAKKLAPAVADPGEFLWSIRQEQRFNTDFLSTPGNIGYHAPCHLRAQAIGFKGRDLVRKIPGVVPKSVMECCGHDGTYAMKVETFDASKRIGQKAFDGLAGTETEVWMTECPLAAMQFEQHAGKKALHPMTVLARAYRHDGFPTAVEEKEDGDAKGDS